MRTYFRVVSIFITLFTILTACTMSVGVESPPPPSSDQVATVVAQTLKANTPAVSPDLLPHSLYFLGKDDQSRVQVFRMERNGKIQSQLTSEAVNVLDFDVSPLDGSFVYELNNQLILRNADGSNRRVIAEGAPREIDFVFYRPVFSPDGQTIAYANSGLTLYDVGSGTSNLVVPDISPDDFSSRESYVPETFAPDGKKLLVHMLHVDTSSIAIYNLTTKTLNRFSDKDDGDFACCQLYREFTWTPDGRSLYVANPNPGVDAGGMWRLDLPTGEATPIVPYGGEGNTFNFVDEPYSAPNGQLYFFYSNYKGDLGPLSRAPVDLGVFRITGDNLREPLGVIRNEKLRMMNEALWALDASFVIVALVPGEDVLEGGQAEMVYLDGRANVVLAPFAQEMKWGP